MHVVRCANAHINPGQMPFITADQPPYATLKQSQWERPDDVGEDIFFFVLVGWLHIETKMLKLIGQ